MKNTSGPKGQKLSESKEYGSNISDGEPLNVEKCGLETLKSGEKISPIDSTKTGGLILRSGSNLCFPTNTILYS